MYRSLIYIYILPTQPPQFPSDDLSFVVAPSCRPFSASHHSAR